MIIPIQQVIPWFIRYKYWIIFPIVVVEGPIITVVSGFLVSAGYLSFWETYLVIIIGDLIGDSLYYALGRFGRQDGIRKYGKYIGLNAKRLQTLETHFTNKPHQTFIVGKAAHGAGVLLLVAAGLAKLPYRKFITANFFPTAVKSLILLVAGFYFGKAYLTFNNYLNYVAIAGVIIFIIAYYIFIKKTSANE